MCDIEGRPTLLRRIQSRMPVGARQLYGRLKRKAGSYLEDVSAIVEHLTSPQSQCHDLIILDDAFPHMLSAFRIAEFNRYLATWPSAVVYSDARSFPTLGETRSYREVWAEYAHHYPYLASRVVKYKRKRTLNGALLYFVFLQGARAFMDQIERHGIPFVFTLYPGGGFNLNQPESDAVLSRVCSSPLLRKVIATQRITYRYLIDRQCLDPEKVEFIYGGVFPSDLLASHNVPRRLYRQDKDTFDICFVAHKYMNKGLDKGYDLFVAVAKLLSGVHSDVFFHVVGQFDEKAIDVSSIANRIKFHGTMHSSSFAEFYSRMDVILSPNVPFVLLPGAFDGFPTGACVEAGLCGVAVFCTDPLDQNVAFRDGEELVIIPRDAVEISDRLSRYRSNYNHLRRLAENGQAAFKRVFDIDAQMNPRLRILSECISGSHNRAATPVGIS